MKPVKSTAPKSAPEVIARSPLRDPASATVQVTDAGTPPQAPSPEPARVEGTPGAAGNGNGHDDSPLLSPTEPGPTPGVLADILTPEAPRKRGRPKGSKDRAPRNLNPEPPSSAPLTPEGVNYKALGGALVAMVTGAATTLIGPEWEPQPHESATLTETTAAYLKAKNVSDIPPGWMLVIAICSYALPRLATDNTQMKIHAARVAIMGEPK